MSKHFLHGLSLFPRQRRGSVSFWAWGRPGLSLIHSVSTPLDFLFLCSDLTPNSCPSQLLCVPVPFCRITVRDSGKRGNSQTLLLLNPLAAWAATGRPGSGSPAPHMVTHQLCGDREDRRRPPAYEITHRLRRSGWEKDDKGSSGANSNPLGPG